MYRSFAMAVIALALVSLPAETSLASPGGKAGKSMDSVTGVAPVPVKSGGMATPAVKKLSPKGGAACFRNCIARCVRRGLGQFLRFCLLRPLTGRGEAE